VRARWRRPTLTATLSSTKATLFHRWLLSTSPGTFVEHLNDIGQPQSERVAALEQSTNSHVKARCLESRKQRRTSAAAKYIRFSADIRPYHACIAKTSQLCLAFKRFKTSYVERKRKRKISTAQSSGSSRATTGYVFMMKGRATRWRSYLQKIATLSSLEAEMLRLHRGTSLVLWGELEGSWWTNWTMPKGVVITTNFTRAELELVIKSLYTHGDSPSPTC
jgi:hypothetical protein